MTKPEYYTENEAGAVSRHAKLTPSMCALVIKSHVTEGLELAKKEQLPPAVAAGIAEHHGTTVMAFFYAKALELDPTTPDHEYRYPGPRPQSKETAIVMLADSIEGASRSLTEPTPAACAAWSTRSSTSACTRGSSTSAASRWPTWRRSARRTCRC